MFTNKLTLQEKVLYNKVTQRWNELKLFELRQAVRDRDTRPKEMSMPFADIASVLVATNDISLDPVKVTSNVNAQYKYKNHKFDAIASEWYEKIKAISDAEKAGIEMCPCSDVKAEAMELVEEVANEVFVVNPPVKESEGPVIYNQLSFEYLKTLKAEEGNCEPLRRKINDLYLTGKLTEEYKEELDKLLNSCKVQQLMSKTMN